MSQVNDWQIGIDQIDHSRFHIYSRDQYPSFYEKVYSLQERHYCEQKANPIPHFAGIFAAKEAAFKAFSPFEKVFITDFEIKHTVDGVPIIAMKGLKNAILLESRKYKLRVSISHAKSSSMAVAMCQSLTQHYKVE